MAWDLIWHRAGKVCVAREMQPALFCPTKTMVLAKLHRTFFSWDWLPGRQTMASSFGSVGDRHSYFDSAEATLSSSKDNRHHQLREAGLTQ